MSVIDPDILGFWEAGCGRKTITRFSSSRDTGARGGQPTEAQCGAPFADRHNQCNNLHAWYNAADGTARD
ncbi:hypothetical protein [Nitrobacter sp.]|uniref:hypothetical protein n=1 Tax=Nitrobacter sp. TaxID=29420 RepID=UPI00399D5870